MPRLTERVPRYCKHKASGQAVVKFGGKLHYLGPHGSARSKLKYKRLVAEWLAANRNTTRLGPDTGDLTVVEVLARYMRYAKQHYRKHGELTGEIDNIRPLRALFLKRIAAS